MAIDKKKKQIGKLPVAYCQLPISSFAQLEIINKSFHITNDIFIAKGQCNSTKIMEVIRVESS